VRHLPIGGRRSAAKRGRSGTERFRGASRRKNSPQQVDLPKRWRTTVGEEGQTGWRPFRRERAKSLREETPGLRRHTMGTSLASKSEGGRKGRETRSLARRRECPRDRKAQESKSARLPTKHREGAKGYGWLGGIKPSRRRYKATRFCRKARGRREERESALRSSSRRKALKGEAHERWELKDAPKGRVT